MMRERFRLRRRVIRELIAQGPGDAAVQRLAAAFEQVLVRRVLDQRVLEAISGVRRQAFDQENIGLGEPLQRLLQWRILHARDRA
jgi:hypothetical protein